MNRRSFITALAGLAAMCGLRKSKSDDEITVQLPYDPEERSSASRTYYLTAFVTIDEIKYTLPYNGVEIINTTGQVIPAGTPIYWAPPTAAKQHIVPHGIGE